MSARFTLSSEASLQQDVRRSRFLARAAPVESVDAAHAFFARVDEADATHNCWAYRIGASYRFNDDGEPGGTAGRPILQAIEGQGCDRVAVVVTRWYGGIKLGTGGLARAYGGTATECLRLAERVAIVAMARLGFVCDFSELALLKARLRELGAEPLQERFGAGGAALEFELPARQVAEAERRIADLSRGRIAVRRMD